MDDEGREIIDAHHEATEEEFEEEEEEEEEDLGTGPRELPSDLPRSLDDRRNYTSYNQETEYYDAWQGEEACLSACSTQR